jgi:phage shock protein PspC (stress-responsive transcriptional regulator)
MKKVFNINLAGVVIAIEEPAYEQLNHYIKQLKSFFANEKDGDEIVQDMEARIAELFQEIIGKRASCITSSDVQQIQSDLNENSDTHTYTQSAYGPNSQHNTGKKLYTNQNDKIIGGVCGGIAQYINIDASIVRILFVVFTLAWGAGIVIYLLMWVLLPKQNDQPLVTIKKRLYRDIENKKIMGVCAGIANYLNISHTTVRLIAVLPLILSLLGNSLFFDWTGFYLSGGFIPTAILVYFILSAIIPAADTVKQKMEMHGTPINLDNIKSAYNDGVEAMQQFVQNSPINRSLINRFFRFIGKCLAVFFVSILFFIVLTLAILLILSLLGLMEPSQNFLYYARLFFSADAYYYVFVMAICCIFFLPIIGITNSLVKIISGKKFFAKPISIASSILFIASIFTIIFIYQNQLGNMQYNKSLSIHNVQMQAYDTLGIQLEDKQLFNEHDQAWMFRINHTYIEENGDQLDLFIPSFIEIKESPDSLIHILTSYSELGHKKKVVHAPFIAQPVIQDNQIILPNYTKITSIKPYLAQQINYEIAIPKGKKYYFKGIHKSNFSKYIFGFRKTGFYINTYNKYGIENNYTYIME